MSGRHVVHEPFAIAGAGIFEGFVEDLEDAGESVAAFEQQWSARSWAALRTACSD